MNWYHVTTLPNKTLTAGIDHVIMAFAASNLFTTNPPGNYTPFEDVETMRSRFDEGVKISMAIGGWGDTQGFGLASTNDTTRKLFASNVAKTIDRLGFDGVGMLLVYQSGYPRIIFC